MTKTVCLDPGHGGSDSGALTPNKYQEQYYTLDVCKRASEILTPYCNVIMTRDSEDEYVGLTARAEISNRANADVFVSYHFNSAENPADGFELFTTPQQNNSDKLAAKIWSSHRKQFPNQKDRGIKQATFTVISKANAPAVLVEGEFLHTVAGEAFVESEENRQKMAHAVVDGVLAYLGLDTAPVLTLEQRVDRVEKHLGL